MIRYIIGSLWDRNNRIGINKNFEYLFEGSKRVDALNSRADNILNKSNATLNEARKTNDMNENVQQQINTLIAESGTSDAEVLQARFDAEGNKYPVLKDRLDESDVQLAQKVDQDEVRNSLNLKRDKAYPITLDDVDLELLEAIEGGEGTSFNLESIPRDYSVSPKKTTFAQKGKNLFSGVYLEDTRLTGSIEAGGIFLQGGGGVSAIIEVEPNTTYTISKSNNTDRFRFATYHTTPVNGTNDLRFIQNVDMLTTYTITTEDDEYYLIINLSSSTQNALPEWMQVEEGSVATEYEDPNKVKINLSKGSISKEALDSDVFADFNGKDIANLSITPEKTTFAKRGRNLFDGNYIYDKSLIRQTDGRYLFFDTPNEVVTVVQKIEGGKTYTISKEASSSNRFVVAVFNESPTENSLSDRVINTANTSETTFTALENEKYVVIYLSNEGYKIPDRFQIEIGSEKTDYVPFDAVEIKLATPIDNNDNKKMVKSIYLTNVISNNYNSEMPYTSPYEHDINAVYSLYDNLVDSHPHYVSKKLLGQETTGLPIYCYDFKPPTPNFQGGVSLSYPKIIYTTGIHGMEKHAVWGALKFFQDLCEKWREDDLLNTFRWNIHFKIVPIVNPHGFNDNERKNGNGVDLNRNFPVGWVEGSDPSARTYPGPYPASELETQIMQGFFDENKDALFFVDHHNSGHWESRGDVIWTSSVEQEVINMLNGYNHFMSSKAKRDYPYIDESLSFESLSIGTGGRLRDYPSSKGIETALLETAVQFNTEQDTQKFQIDAVGNLILSIVKNYS